MYASTREKDPALDVLPAFVQALAGPLFQTFAALAPVRTDSKTPVVAFSKTSSLPPSPPPQLFGTVSKVAFPFAYGGIKAKVSAIDPFFNRNAFTAALPRLAAKVKFEEVPTSECARDFVDYLAKELPNAIDPTCSDVSPDFAVCKGMFDEFLSKSYVTARDNCPSSTHNEQDVDALVVADKRFREFVTSSLTNSAELEQSFRNRPRTRYSFGAGTAVFLKDSIKSNRPRAKLDSGGKLVADPLNRVITMAFVNLAPWGYDADGRNPRPGSTSGSSRAPL